MSTSRDRTPRRIPSTGRVTLTAVTRLNRVEHDWAGHRDGRRAARRLSHLGAHVWVARRRREQAMLDAAVTAAVQSWTEEAYDPISVLTEDTWPEPTVEGPADVVGRAPGMAGVRAERRRRTGQAHQRAEGAARRTRTAAARTQLDALCKSTASTVATLEAHHNLLFALYTRAFLRAYSRATTVHAPEPTWLRHLVDPGSLMLAQTVLQKEAD